MPEAAKMRQICRDALRRLKPTAAEARAMPAFTERLLKTAAAIAKPYNAKPMMCGSVAKGTWLAQKNEVDLFLLFSRALPRKGLEDFGLRCAKDIMEAMPGKYRMAYAEHPYLTGTMADSGTSFKVDIVPCYDITDPAKIISAVDRTPHHVRYVKQKLKLLDDVRLLKAFAMAAGVYGADTRTQGLSGYLCELLVLNYGPFPDLARKVAKWHAGIALDLKVDKIKADKLFKKFHAPLIVIDPVDPNRNVAAAVSVENFFRFVRACKDFLAAPSGRFFYPEERKPWSAAEISKAIKARGTRWYVMSFKRPDIVDDILWPQMRRCLDIIQTRLHEADFEVLRKGCWADDRQCVLVLEMKEWLLPRIDKNIGPNVYSRYAADFLSHYKEHRVFIEGESWVVELPHEHISVLFFLKDLLAKSEKELLKAGIPTHLAGAMSDAAVAGGGDAQKAMSGLPDQFRAWLRGWFETDLNIAD